jgi:hypothetical protein
VKALGKVVQLQPEDAASWHALGRECIQVGDEDALASVITRLRALDPTAAERLVLEHATAAGRRENLGVPLPTRALAATRASAQKKSAKDELSFDAWLGAVDQPAFGLNQAGAELALRH